MKRAAVCGAIVMLRVDDPLEDPDNPPDTSLLARRLSKEEQLRIEVTEILANGLKTRVDPIPENGVEFARIVDELSRLDADDVVGKLVVSGYIDRPHPENGQRCLECIYYKPRRRWCVIDELNLPAEAEWWCRLWRM